MGPCLSCTRHDAHEAEADIVVPVRRGVVVPVRRTAVRRGVVPASTPFHAVRTRHRTFSARPNPSVFPKCDGRKIPLNPYHRTPPSAADAHLANRPPLISPAANCSSRSLNFRRVRSSRVLWSRQPPRKIRNPRKPRPSVTGATTVRSPLISSPRDSVKPVFHPPQGAAAPCATPARTVRVSAGRGGLPPSRPVRTLPAMARSSRGGSRHCCSGPTGGRCPGSPSGSPTRCCSSFHPGPRGTNPTPHLWDQNR